MRDVSPELASHLEGGTTTLCKCLRLTLTDGAVIGLTDHDAPLNVDEQSYLPADGFEASEESHALGPATGEWDLHAALRSDLLNEDDLTRGRYDGATVETFLVNWADPSQFALESAGTLGQVSAHDGAFRAEVRGPFAAFDAVRGRVFAARCDAELGDARCGVNLDDPALTVSGQIELGASAHVFHLNGTIAYPNDHFTGGTIHRASGNSLRIRLHEVDSEGRSTVTLWAAPDPALAPDETVSLKAGCDKSYTCCANRFANAERFRGFPFMPGDDFALSYPNKSDGNLDGGSIGSGP